MRAALVALILLEAFLATAQTQLFCVELVQDDVTCTGYHDNFPSKVCHLQNPNFDSSRMCDLPIIFSSWQGLCPKKNLNASQFCEGTGFVFPYSPSTSLSGTPWMRIRQGLQHWISSSRTNSPSAIALLRMLHWVLWGGDLSRKSEEQRNVHE